MWGPTKGRSSAGIGAAELRASGVMGNRTEGVWPVLASWWVSAIASKCSESNAGRRWKAPRSENDDDTTISYAHCIVPMAIPATAQWYALRTGFLSGCATRAMFSDSGTSPGSRERETDCDVREERPQAKTAINKDSAQSVVAPGVGTTKDRCGSESLAPLAQSM